MNEYTEVSRLAITDIPKFILAVICSFASKLFSQENDTVAKAAEEVMQAYRDINTNIEELKRTGNDTAKDTTANSTLLFDKNVATDSSLSPIDKAVYSVLCALINPETSQCSPKVKTIATHASCSESAVRKSLGTLEKHGVIKRKFRYLNHRQISSLYTVIRTGAEASSNEENTQIHTHSNTTPVEAEKKSAVEMVSNITETTSTCFLGDTKNKAIALHEEEGDNGQHHEEGKKILRVFKDSLREEGASLPALAEEVNPTEETKDSLTGGALLPILEGEKTKKPEVPESIPSTSEKTEEPLFIRAESNGTTADNNVLSAFQPKSELSEALLHEYDQLRREYTRNEKPTEAPKSVASGVKGVLANIMKKRVIKSGDDGVLAMPENLSAEECEAPVVKAEEVSVVRSSASSENPAKNPATDVVPAEKFPEPKTECDTLMASAEPAKTARIPVPETAGDTSASSTEAQTATAENVPTQNDTGKKPVKKSCKGKRTVSQHPKELYSPEDAPEIMRSTAEYFLLKTGRVALRWEEISVLRKFSATQYPAVVQKEIRRACERFKKRNESLACLTLMYIEVALRDRPTYGSKAKAKKEAKKGEAQSSSAVNEKTEEEKAAEEAQAAAEMARIEELQAQINEEIRINNEKRYKWLFGGK